MISTLDFLYVVLALGLISVFVPLSMILWRTYKMMDHVDKIIALVEKTTTFVSNAPSMVMEKFLSHFGK